MSFVLAVIAGVTPTPIPIPAPAPAVPLKPAIEAPLGVHRGTFGATFPQLRWTHGGISTGGASAAPTNLFLICILPVDWMQQCSSANATWRGAPTTFPRVQMRMPGTNQPIVGAYRYTFTPAQALPDNRLDRTLAYTIGACETASGTNCTFSTPQFLYYTTLDLEPVSIFKNSMPIAGGHELQTAITIRNNGEGIVWGTRVDVNLYRAKTVGGACTRDVTLASPNFPSVVLFDGRIVRPNAVTNPSDARAILDSGSSAFTWSGVLQVGGTGSEATANLTGPSGDLYFDFFFNTNETERAYVYVAKIDPTDAVVEYQETNNGRAECRTYPNLN
jgi:hypothetical protein